MTRKPPGPPLSDEDQHVWKELTKQVRPLKKQEREEAASALSPAPLPPVRVKDYIPPNAPKHKQNAPLTVGAYANIDRNTAERFRKGHAPIDATLDLHGLTRDKAHVALGNFLRNQHQRGSRCVLVVTGKGRREGVQKDVSDGQDRGILREMLPVWLADFDAIVLAFDVAKQQHGGRGAFYILLRRKR